MGIFAKSNEDNSFISKFSVHKGSLSKVKFENDKSELSIEGMLDIGDYIQEVEPSEKTRQAISAWTIHQREITKGKCLNYLINIFASTLAASFILLGTALVNPEVDKQFVKDTISLIITPQITLLSGVLCTYILHTRDKRKQKQ